MPIMIRTGLTHGILKPDNLPLDIAYEVGTGTYQCSLITTENVIHIFCAATNGIGYYYSDNDGKDWTYALIPLTAIDAQRVGCDSYNNDIYLVIGASDGKYYFMKGTKTGAYTWTWGAEKYICDSQYGWDMSTVNIHSFSANDHTVIIGENWLFNYFVPKYSTSNGGTNWTDAGGGKDGMCRGSWYDSGNTRIMALWGHM